MRPSQLVLLDRPLCDVTSHSALTRVQGVLGAEYRAGTDNVDHAPRVPSNFLHQHGEVTDLSLQVRDERALDVQQRGGLSVLTLQLTEAMLLRRVHVKLFFTLLCREAVGDFHMRSSARNKTPEYIQLCLKREKNSKIYSQVQKFAHPMKSTQSLLAAA